MLSSILQFFTGGGTSAIEKIASEWIETDLEKAEAQTLMLKTLDPNGKMRRDISKRVGTLYSTYFVFMLILISFEFFGVGSVVNLDMATATDKLKELFIPVTGLYGAIVTASFGVNYANVKSGK